MIKKRNICIVSSSRADYNHLFLLMKTLKASKEINFKLLVTGMHLLKEFGETYKEIIKDGFQIDAFVKNKSYKGSSNASLSIMSDQLKNISNQLDMIKPDIVVILGDRYDILQVAISCHIKNIPIAHFHGGEVTHGAIDDAIRHSITKFSDIHFVADKIFAKRVQQLGENPRNIHNIGSLGVLAIKATKKINKSDILKKYNIQGKYILIALHPETINADTKSVTESLFTVLSKQKNLHIVFSAPNSDPGSNMILRNIKSFIKLFPHTSSFIVSAGREDFINLIRYAELIIGNSSSCLIEAPALGTTSLIIGKRQNGRPLAKTVNKSGISYNAISNCMNKLLAENSKPIKDKNLAYKSSNSLLRITKILSKISLDSIKLKRFIDYK